MPHPALNKIYIFSIIILFILTSSKNEKGFVITGHITGIADSTQVMLTNISTGEDIDSAFVIKNIFRFSGKLADSPEELRIISGRNELLKGNLFYTDLLMGNESVDITGDVSDMPLNVTTTGSVVQRQAERYHKQLHAWNVKVSRLRVLLKASSDSVNNGKTEQVAARLKAVDDSAEQWKTNFIKDNFNSYVALVLYNYRRDFPSDTLKKLYDNLSAELKQSKFGKSINIQVNYPKPRTGKNYYDFAAITAKGDSFKLSAIKTRFIVLQFAGSGCYWSHLSIPEIKRLSQQYRDSVSFVSYFIDSRTAWLDALKRDGIGWLSIWSNGTKYSEACSKYGVTGTPTFFLIGPDKKVVATWFGYEDGIVEKEIKMALSR